MTAVIICIRDDHLKTLGPVDAVDENETDRKCDGSRAFESAKGNSSGPGGLTASGARNFRVTENDEMSEYDSGRNDRRRSVVCSRSERRERQRANDR